MQAPLVAVAGLVTLLGVGCTTIIGLQDLPEPAGVDATGGTATSTAGTAAATGGNAASAAGVSAAGGEGGATRSADDGAAGRGGIDLRCSGVDANACGGCGILAQPPGGSCGVCGTYECSADKSETACNDPGLNACGGCTALDASVGESCGSCSVTACAPNKNALVCNSQCTSGQVCVSALNQCKTPDCSAAESCGNSDGAGATCTDAAGNCPAKPNATGSCVGSSCAYVCTGPKLSCSTSSRPACGSWNFESNGVEGWSLSSRLDSASSGDVYVTAPPGPGGGSHSLAVKVDSTSDDNSVVEVWVVLCDGANATGIQGSFYASVWFEPSDGLGAASGPAFAYPANSTGSSVGGVYVDVPANQWFDVFTNPIAGEGEVGVAVRVTGIGNRKGVVYFDNMRFE